MATGTILKNTDSVKTYNFKSNGITFNAVKIGRVCTLSAISGTTPALASHTILVNLQAALRPAVSLNTSDVGNKNYRVMINPDGNVILNESYVAGSYSRWSATYVTAS